MRRTAKNHNLTKTQTLYFCKIFQDFIIVLVCILSGNTQPISIRVSLINVYKTFIKDTRWEKSNLLYLCAFMQNNLFENQFPGGVQFLFIETRLWFLMFCKHLSTILVGKTKSFVSMHICIKKNLFEKQFPCYTLSKLTR